MWWWSKKNTSSGRPGCVLTSLSFFYPRTFHSAPPSHPILRPTGNETFFLSVETSQKLQNSRKRKVQTKNSVLWRLSNGSQFDWFMIRWFIFTFFFCSFSVGVWDLNNEPACCVRVGGEPPPYATSNAICQQKIREFWDSRMFTSETFFGELFLLASSVADGKSVENCLDQRRITPNQKLENQLISLIAPKRHTHFASLSLGSFTRHSIFCEGMMTHLSRREEVCHFPFPMDMFVARSQDGDGNRVFVCVCRRVDSSREFGNGVLHLFFSLLNELPHRWIWSILIYLLTDDERAREEMEEFLMENWHARIVYSHIGSWRVDLCYRKREIKSLKLSFHFSSTINIFHFSHISLGELWKMKFSSESSIINFIIVLFHLARASSVLRTGWLLPFVFLTTSTLVHIFHFQRALLYPKRNHLTFFFLFWSCFTNSIRKHFFSRS